MKNFAVIDERAGLKIFKSIDDLGFDVIQFKKHHYVSSSCSSHPDIFIFRLNKNTVVYAPGTDENLLEKLSRRGVILIEGNINPGKLYPDEVRYNALVIGNYLFHRTDVTDVKIISEAAKAGLEPVNVKQGYTACSVSLINKNTIMTSDHSIHTAALSKGIDSFLLPPQKNIRLDGASYGFIGGATGRIDDGRLAFAGNAANLPSYEAVKRFLDSKKIDIVNLSDDNVTDLGTLMFFTL